MVIWSNRDYTEYSESSGDILGYKSFMSPYLFHADTYTNRITRVLTG